MFEQWWIDEAPSTNRLAMELLAEGRLPLPAALICRTQTHGQGQGSNSWESEPLANITMSVVVQPLFLQAHEQFSLSQMVALAVIDFLALHSIDAKIKWPNDIYVNDKKICGVLIENRLIGSSIDACVIGIGININQTVFVSNAPNPTSFSIESGKEMAISFAVDELLLTIEKRYANLIANKESIHLQYQSLLYKKNRRAQYCANDGVFTGEIRGVLASGLLQMWDYDSAQLRTFAFKEVQYLLS